MIHLRFILGDVVRYFEDKAILRFDFEKSCQRQGTSIIKVIYKT